MARKPWADRGSRHTRGYGSVWTRLRVRILDRDGHLRQPCRRQGKVRLAAHVDHIVPKANGGMDDPANLQAICREHHEAKTAAERGDHSGRKVEGQEGLPQFPLHLILRHQ